MSKENIFEGWDKQTIKKYQHWQLRTIVVSMIGYAIYYFVRKNFSIAMPGLTAQYGISFMRIVKPCVRLRSEHQRLDHRSGRRSGFYQYARDGNGGDNHMQPAVSGCRLSAVRTPATLLDTPLAACHKDVYMEYLTFNWSGTRCCRMRIHNGNYGYRPQF